MSKIRLTAMNALLLVLASLPAWPQGWPAKQLRVVVPVAAGSSTDIVPRAVFEQLGPQLGQSIVIENRAGAGGTIGTASVARAEPDGYTILAHGSAHTISQSLYRDLPYDPARDFAAVVPLGATPLVLVVAPSKGYRSVADLVAAGKARPGALNFSSVGIGSATHMGAERFLASAGVSAVHIPFKGGAEAMTEALAGRVDFFFGPVVLVQPMIREGRLVPLAVNGSKRNTLLADVPTLRESGISNAEYPIWFGLFVPARTPRDVVEKLNLETTRAMQAPALREKLLAMGLDPMRMTPAEFDAYVREEVAINAKLVKAVGIRVE